MGSDRVNGLKTKGVSLMEKKSAIQVINTSIGFKQLDSQNTHWSNVVAYGGIDGWWLNIPFYKFSMDLNLILNNENKSSFVHVLIPANSIKNPEDKFRNKNETADIFIPISGSNYMIDTQSGSSRHNFSVYKSKDYNY